MVSLLADGLYQSIFFSGLEGMTGLAWPSPLWRLDGCCALKKFGALVANGIKKCETSR
jgi:hypothetical protein